MFDYPLMDVML